KLFLRVTFSSRVPFFVSERRMGKIVLPVAKRDVLVSSGLNGNFCHLATLPYDVRIALCNPFTSLASA
ncbi:MAG: hypothetical protein ACTHLX_12115, partial [Candidatus Binatia bacterium]